MKNKIKDIVNGLIRRGYWFNNEYFPDCRKFLWYKTFNTEVVNVGSTSAVSAFNYSDTTIKAANFAMRRNPLLGDLAILQNYSSFLAPHTSIVIIPLCPFTALSGSYDYMDDRYYKVLYPSTISHYSYFHELEVSAKWNNPVLNYPWYALFIDVWRFFFKSKSKVLSECELKRDAEVKYSSWCHEFSISDFSSPLSLKNMDGIEDAIKLLGDIVSFCEVKYFEPVIVIPPVYKTLSEKFRQPEKEVLFDSILNTPIVKKVRCLNYFDSELFSNNRALFKDSFLLNEKGARLFTKHVLTSLRDTKD